MLGCSLALAAPFAVWLVDFELRPAGLSWNKVHSKNRCKQGFVEQAVNPFEKLPARLECTLALLAGHARCVFWRWTSAFTGLAESNLARSRSRETHRLALATAKLFSGVVSGDQCSG